jgi:hypothetical protein
LTQAKNARGGTEEVGRAMIAAVRTQPSQRIVESADIVRLAGA